MADRFDRFSERARRALTLAQEESQRFNHNYLGTEHLLLGLVRVQEGVAAKVLVSLGVDLSKVRSAVGFIIGRGEKAPRGEMGLTPGAKKVIELSLNEARRLNHSYIGTEHLLLGLLAEGEGIAFGVLQSLGVTLEGVRTETARVLSGASPATGGARPSQAAFEEARGAIEEATAAIDALGASDLAADLSRALLLPALRLTLGHLQALAFGNLPVSGSLEIRRLIDGDLLLLDEAAAVFERHDLENLASLVRAAAARTRESLD